MEQPTDPKPPPPKQKKERKKKYTKPEFNLTIQKKDVMVMFH
jgi:hypothetical protein